MERNSVFIERKFQYVQYVISAQIDLLVHFNPNQNHTKLLCGCQQNVFKFYMEGRRQNIQHNIKGQDQSWRTEATQFQDLL